MRTRTFMAPDLHQALALVRAELGADAMILKCETDPDGSVRLYAGGNTAEEQEAADEAEASATASATIVPFSSFEARHREKLVASLRSDPAIKRALPALPFDREALAAILKLHRLPHVLTDSLVNHADASGLDDLALALASALDARMCLPQNTSTARLPSAATLVIGPYGAGKTSVAARLAAHAQNGGERVTLIATDLDGAGQMARLEGFAGHLDIAVTAAATPEALLDALAIAERDGARAIADSAGFDPRKALLHPFGDIEGLDLLGVVSASADAEEAFEMAQGFIRQSVKRLIVTGLDSARRKGALAVYATSGLAVTHVTDSPFFCDGLIPFSPLRLARDLLSPME